MSKSSDAAGSPPEFFVDRSLGAVVVAERLREEGVTVHVMLDEYPDLDTLADETWIAEQTALGRVLLTKDDNIRREQGPKDAVTRFDARMFCITNGNLTGAEMADRFASHLERILEICEQPGPFVYGVYAEGPRRLAI